MTSPEVLAACLQDAIDRSAVRMDTSTHAGVEGSFLLVKPANNLQPLVSAMCVDPDESPFDDDAVERLRSVSMRMHAPFMMICSFRMCVLYDVEALSKQRSHEGQVLLMIKGADVTSADAVMTSAKRVELTESLRRCIVRCVELDRARSDPENSILQALSAPAGEQSANFFHRRIVHLLDELLYCTEALPADRDAIVNIVTGVLGHTLVRLQRPADLDALTLPATIREPRLMLDIISAFLREAYRAGYAMFPVNVSDVNILPSKRKLFRSTLADFISFVHAFDLGKLEADVLALAIDGVLSWCFEQYGTPVPTIDAIDLALSTMHISSLSERDIPQILEVGSTLGAFGVRARLFHPLCDTRVYAPSEAEERLVLLRSLGRLRDPSDLRIIRRHEDTDHPWDLVCISLTHVSERHRLLLLLQSQKLSDNARVVVFAPLAALRDAEFADVRRVLLDRFRLRWVLTADAEPLAVPDNGTCCIVAEFRPGFDKQELHERHAEFDTTTAHFAFLRKPLSSVVTPAESIRDLSTSRREQLSIFIRYLSASERGKINDEVVVRKVAAADLRSRSSTAEGGWDDLIIPPDVIASILRKLAGKTVALRKIASVSGGLRIGATDVLAPRIEEIASEHLEYKYLQYQGAETVLITSADELDCIAGIPSSNRRLMILPEDRSEMDATMALRRIEQAEREGVHERPTVKTRKPWWSIRDLGIPHLFIPRQLRDRWLVAINRTNAFVSDSFIAIRLHEPAHTEALALWMNSSLGMFLSELVRSHTHVFDVTVRDVQEFPVPTDEILKLMDVRRFKQLLHRRSGTILDEFGTVDADVVRPKIIRRDRLRLDLSFMHNMFGFTDEETRWVYRFALAWLSSSTNVRHLANALAAEIMLGYRVRPMREWYTPRIEQLPASAQRTIIIPPGVTHAESSRSMFGWQVTLFRGSRTDDVLDCSCAEESEILELLINLGKRYIDVPMDPPLIAEVLTLARTFTSELEHSITELTEPLPEDIRETVGNAVRAVMTEA